MFNINTGWERIWNKSRDITLLTKIHIVKGMLFPIVMYRCESSTTKKVEGWRTDAFKLWSWRRFLRLLWTARTSVQFSTVAQSCPTLCDPIDGSPPGSAVPGILQARTLEWVALSSSLQFRGLSRVFSSTTFQKHQFFKAQPSLCNSHIHTCLL